MPENGRLRRKGASGKSLYRLLELPAFKKLAKMPESELRSLVAGKGADRLMDRFINEMAKDLKDQKQAVHHPNTVNGHPEIPNQNPTL